MAYANTGRSKVDPRQPRLVPLDSPVRLDSFMGHVLSTSESGTDMTYSDEMGEFVALSNAEQRNYLNNLHDEDEIKRLFPNGVFQSYVIDSGNEGTLVVKFNFVEDELLSTTLIGYGWNDHR